MRYQVAPGKWEDTGPQPAPERLRRAISGVTVASEAAIPPNLRNTFGIAPPTGGIFNPSMTTIRKELCKRGHPLHGANVRIKNGRRHCRACHRARQTAWMKGKAA